MKKIIFLIQVVVCSITANVPWLCLVAEKQDLIFKLKTMNTSTKQTENLAECGNKSKPLLQAVFFSPYLPYSVKIAYDYFGDTQEIATLIGVEDRNGETRLQVDTGGSALLKYCKLVLKPISDLSLLVIEEFEKYDGLRSGKANEEIINLFCEENGVDEIIENIELKSLPYNCIEFMFKNHYDFFGLIEKGLAVSVHDVV